MARLPHPPAGYAVAGTTLATWGEAVTWTTLPGGATRRLPVAGHFGEGGALADVDGDGQLDLVLNQEDPKALVWYRNPRWERRQIDTGVDAPDMLATTLFGRRGVLLIHKRAQVRFYMPAAGLDAPWEARDIYSIYTPSWQGGLRVADVDGDGRPDILCGNYWIRAPERFELPWRLFAVNTWTEEEPSGTMRLAWDGREVAAQRLLGQGRVAWFERPANPTEPWLERRIGGFDHPASVEIVDLDGDGRPEVLVAENGGAGRLLAIGDAGTLELRRGAPVRGAFVTGGRDIVVIRGTAVEYGAAVR